MGMTMEQNHHDVLKRAIQDSSKKTQQFLSPLLHLQPVQYLLTTFANDPTRTFEQFVWDPSTQAVLKKLETISMDREATKTLTTDFAVELTKATALSEDYWKERMEKKHADGKTLFKARNWYAAMNAFTESIESLYKVHQQETTDDCEPSAWKQPELRERYVTLCCNITVCALKLKDCSTLKTYANKALAVDAHSRKAMNALAHAHAMEHRFDEARQVIETALGLYPNDKELLRVKQEVDIMEQKEMEERAALAAIKLQRDADEAVRREAQQAAEAERTARLTRAQEVTPLPLPGRDGTATQRLHTYFSQIKHELLVDFNQLHNPHAGEEPLFECSLIDRMTGVVLASGVTAASKQKAKNEASHVAILKLWEMKRNEGKFLPEDEERWTAYELAKEQGKTDSISTEGVEKEASNRPVRLTIYERRNEPVMLLNQLHAQRRLVVDFMIFDVSPLTLLTTEFKCKCSINGQEMGVASAISKKKAKVEAAQMALEKALELGVIEWSTSPSDGSEGREDAKEQEESMTMATAGIAAVSVEPDSVKESS